jgi:hypothetical protein
LTNNSARNLLKQRLNVKYPMGVTGPFNLHWSSPSLFLSSQQHCALHKMSAAIYAKKPLRNSPPRDGKISALHEYLPQHSTMERGLLVMLQKGLRGNVALVADERFHVADLHSESVSLSRRGRLPRRPHFGRVRATQTTRPRTAVGQVTPRVQFARRSGAAMTVTVGRHLRPRFQRSDAGLDGPIITGPTRR